MAPRAVVPVRRREASSSAQHDLDLRRPGGKGEGAGGAAAAKEEEKKEEEEEMDLGGGMDMFGGSGGGGLGKNNDLLKTRASSSNMRIAFVLSSLLSLSSFISWDLTNTLHLSAACFINDICASYN